MTEYRGAEMYLQRLQFWKCHLPTPCIPDTYRNAFDSIGLRVLSYSSLIISILNCFVSRYLFVVDTDNRTQTCKYFLS